MDEEAAGGGYLHVRRDSAGVISGVDVLTKEQFRELADQRMNAASDTTYEESTLMSYVDPADGRTYYSFDGGKTFEPLTDAEFEARFPPPDVVWWTYDEYKAWLDNEKVELQSLLGQTGGDYTWTQQKIDETIALYESILKDIQNGVLYSKTVDGSDDVMLSMNPADIAKTAGCPKNSGGSKRKGGETRLEEREALKRLKHREEDALAWFIDRYTAYVSTIVSNILGPAAASADLEAIASDVFFAFWTHAKEIRPGKAKAYLGSIARNKAKESTRKTGRELPLEDDMLVISSGTPERELEKREQAAYIRKAVLALREPEREIFLRYYYFYQMCIRDSVKTKLFRGRKKLKEVLEKGGYFVEA